MKRWLLRLGLVVLGPLAILLVIEVVWQMVGDPRIAETKAWLASVGPHSRLGSMGMVVLDEDPKISFRLKPGFDAKVGGHRYRINSYGLRGPEVAMDRPAGKRVLVLGDSYAFGYGVDEDATISAQLQKQLGEKGVKAEVLNFGVPAYHTGQEAQYLELEGFRFSPELVVLVYYPNDNIESALLYDPRHKFLYVDELPLSYGLKQFFSRSIVYSRITKGYTQYLGRAGHLDTKGLRHWAVTQKRIEHIAELCKKNRVKFLLVAIPTVTHSRWLVMPEHQTTIDHERLLAFLRTAELPFVDIRKILIERGKPVEELHVSREEPRDAHFNAEGYRLLTKDVVRAIEEHGLLR